MEDSVNQGNNGRGNSGRGNSGRGNSGRGNSGRGNSGRGDSEQVGSEVVTIATTLPTPVIPTGGSPVTGVMGQQVVTRTTTPRATTSPSAPSPDGSVGVAVGVTIPLVMAAIVVVVVVAVVLACIRSKRGKSLDRVHGTTQANRYTTQSHAHIQDGCSHPYNSTLEPEYAEITAGPNYTTVQVNTEPQNRHRYETSHATSRDIPSGYAVLEPKSPVEANSPSPEPPGGPLEHSLMEMSVEEFPFKQECRELIMDLPGSPKLIRKQEGGNPSLRSMSCVDQYPFEQSPYMEPVSIHRNHANSRPLSMDFDYISRNMGTLLERIRSEDL